MNHKIEKLQRHIIEKYGLILNENQSIDIINICYTKKKKDVNLLKKEFEDIKNYLENIFKLNLFDKSRRIENVRLRYLFTKIAQKRELQDYAISLYLKLSPSVINHYLSENYKELNSEENKQIIKNYGIKRNS